MKTSNPNSSAIRWLWLAAVVLLLDQLSKYWVSVSIPYGRGVDVWPFLNLVYVFNPGAAFSFLADQSGWQRWLFTGFAMVVVVVMTIWLKRLPSNSRWLGCSLGLIIGGALGNVVDRVRLGHVVDFIDFHLGTWHWPVFNLADSWVCIGAIMLILDSLISKSDKKES